MACSCKKKDTTNYQIAVQAKNISQTLIEKPITTVTQPVTVEPTKVTYNYQATTKPLQSCPYCASKHISLALALIKDNQKGAILIAIGQLMAASYHYNKAQSTQYNALISIVDKIIDSKFQVDSDIIAQLSSLAGQAQQITVLRQAKQQIPSTFQYSPREALKHACLAFSLMFTQIFYQTINKSYVVGQLVLAALHLQQQDRPRAKKLRQIWKVVQEIKGPNDQDYIKSRTMLMDFMEELQQALIIIV